MAVLSPPVGTIALLFTDIEGSTRWATAWSDDWAGVLEDHHAIVRGEVAKQDGFVAGIDGDAFFATFSNAPAAARAAVAVTRELRDHRWPFGVGQLRVRMGLHVGDVEWSSTGYVGLEVHRAARVAAAAHGGQLLLTAAAQAMVGPAVETESLGAHRLKDFPEPEVLYCAVIDGRGASGFPEPRTQSVRPTNLPAGIPRLIGRGTEVEEVRDALVGEGQRLVTIAGPGGVGKTSLALVIAEGLLDAFPGGVWLVRLAPLSTSDAVLPAIEAALGGEAEANGASFDAIVRRLRGRGNTLVVLDSFEHVLAGAVSLGELLDAAPQLSVLVTSQAPLRLASERVLAIGSLDPDAAVSLIADVARQRAAQLSSDPRQREALNQIAALLDGLPLALELAAARLSLWTPSQLADRLRRSIDVLREDRRDRPERHRSLRATVQWTLDSLAAQGRELFVRLGAFAGPAELGDIEIIAGEDGLDVVDALSALLDVALVRRVELGDSRVRFALPEALRQIASATLDERPDGARWREAHLRRQYEVLWEARARIGTATADRAARDSDLEAAAALDWALETYDPRSAWITAMRAAFLGRRGRLREGQALLEPLLASLPEDRELRAYVHLTHAWLLLEAAQLDGALRAADSALALTSDPHVQGAALKTRGALWQRAGRFDKAIRDHERFTSLARNLGAAELANALITESQSRMDAGELERGAALLAEAERIAPGSDALGIWPAHSIRGDLALVSDRPLEAAGHYARSLESAQELRDELQVRLDLVGIADALSAGGRDADALEVAGIAEAIGDDLGVDRGTEWHVAGRDHIREAAERLGTGAAERALTRGRAVPAGRRVLRAASLARDA